MILAGDVGGTKTLLGLFERHARGLRPVREASYASRDYDSLEAIGVEFLDGERGRIEAAAIGVAGPVTDGRSTVVNLRWPVDARRVARRLGIGEVRVINDLEATAWGIPLLRGRQLASLTPRARPQPGNAALIAAGTGLGMALLFWDGERHRPSASEGGHQGFAPRDAIEAELLRRLRRRHGRVSVERVVSGPGLQAIYGQLVDTAGGRTARARARRLASEPDPSAAIAAAGLSGEDPIAARAVDRFVSAYGAAAGDLALVAKAVAGVYVGGGIAPKILERLKQGPFMRAFLAKGRLMPLVAGIPVHIVLEPRTALLGAAAHAAAGGGGAGLRSGSTLRATRGGNR